MVFSYGPDILHQRQLACLIRWATSLSPEGYANQRQELKVTKTASSPSSGDFEIILHLFQWSSKSVSYTRWGEIHQVLLWLLFFLLCLGLTLRYDACADTARRRWSIRRMCWHCQEAKVKLRQKLGTFPCATVKNRVWRKRKLTVSTQHLYITR